MEQTSLEELKRTAASGAYRRIPIWREIFSDIATPVQVLKKLLAVSDHCFLLESAEDNKQWGRYSFLGFDPAMELTCMNHQVTITTDHVEQFETENPAQVIARVIEENRAPQIKKLPPLTGGLVGYFAYDYIKYAEPTLRLDAEDQEKFRDVDLMLFDKMIAFDHYRQKIILICNSRISEADVQAEGGQTAGAAAATDLRARGKSARAAATDAPVSAAEPDTLEAVYRTALQTLDQMQDIIEKGAEKNVSAGRLTTELTPLFDQESYCEKVEQVKHYIHEGDIFQLVLSNRLEAGFDGSLLDTYRILRTKNPSPYMFYFSSDDLEIAGASPETLVKVDNQTAYTFPLAGTRPRGKDEKEDQELEADLLSDEKELTAEEIETLKPEAIILSPGPGRPQDAGCCIEVVQKLGGKIPILGVCLGHQVICEAYGGVVSYAKQLMHGKQSVTKLDTKTPLFVGLPEETTVARYHSLAAQEETFPECLQVTARTSDGEIMALQHKTKAVYGVQFHPESILTPLGKKMLENFLQLANAEKKEKTMIKEAIVKLAAKQNLDYEIAEASMDEIMGGKASPVQMSAFLTAMAMKGETIEEITACAAGMRKHCVRLLHDQDVLEIVGTGGDHSNSFNISTTSSLVISAAGVPVAKHGNRAASSKSGAADVLEALGVKITIDPAKSAEVLKKIGLCFLFAQNYHLSMKYVAPVRKELGIRTIFNILGPLTNPAGANMELMGVYDEALVEPLARVLANLGVKKAMVVYGQDGLDEISMSAPTTVCEVKDGEFLSYVITPEQFGFTRCSKDELIGGSPQDNAQIALAILKGEKGPRRDAVVLNSAAAIHIAKGISIEDAIREAQEVIDSGKALAQLEQFAALTNQE
jgi:hypothetical protein